MTTSSRQTHPEPGGAHTTVRGPAGTKPRKMSAKEADAPRVKPAPRSKIMDDAGDDTLDDLFNDMPV